MKSDVEKPGAEGLPGGDEGGRKMTGNDEFRDTMLSLLRQIAADLHDMNTLALKREHNRQYMVEYRKKHPKGVSLRESVNLQKEREGKEESSPHTPLKGEREGKENPLLERACACVYTRTASVPVPEEPPSAVIDVTKPPTLGQVLWHAHHKCDFHDDAWTCRWFDTMVEFNWRRSNGEPVGNWIQCFYTWRTNEAFFKKLRDPERLPDARRPNVRKPSNWRGTPREDIEDVLG